MAGRTTLQIRRGVNTLATQSKDAALEQAFSDAFPDEIIKKVDGYDNVAPHHYRKRLVDNIPFEYDVLVGEPVVLGKSVISVKTTIILPNGHRSEANGTATIADKEGNINAEGVLYAVREAQSTGLKLALTNYGMGLDLYFGHDDEGEDEKPRPSRKQNSKTTRKPDPEPEEEDEEEEEAPAPRRSTRSSNARSSSKGSNDWESKREKFTYPMGKNKDTSYADLESNFLVWAEENLDPDDAKYGEKNAKILKCVQAEIKYRKDKGEWNPEKKKSGSRKPARKSNINEGDGEDDF